MQDDGSKRKRCTECRRWFAPAATAATSQRVCGTECRKKRRLRLARARRAERVQEYRVDERERQRERRQRRREAENKGPGGAAGGGGHAPPSAGNVAELAARLL